MKLAVVLSTHPAQFQAATFKGDLDENLAYIAGLGYDGGAWQVDVAWQEWPSTSMDDEMVVTGSYLLK